MRIVERLFGRICPSTTKFGSCAEGSCTRAINKRSEKERSASSDHDAVRRSKWSIAGSSRFVRRFASSARVAISYRSATIERWRLV